MVQEVTIWKVFLPPPGLLMALNDYVTNILGSKANVRVLKTLIHHRGKVFAIRELARTAGLSHPEVSRVVKELEKTRDSKAPTRRQGSAD